MTMEYFPTVAQLFVNFFTRLTHILANLITFIIVPSKVEKHRYIPMSVLLFSITLTHNE
jgi:hypothetical protein